MKSQACEGGPRIDYDLGVGITTTLRLIDPSSDTVVPVRGLVVLTPGATAPTNHKERAWGGPISFWLVTKSEKGRLGALFWPSG